MPNFSQVAAYFLTLTQGAKMPIKNSADKIRKLKLEIAKLRKENARLQRLLSQYEDDENSDDDDDDDDEEEDY